MSESAKPVEQSFKLAAVEMGLVGRQGSLWGVAIVKPLFLLHTSCDPWEMSGRGCPNPSDGGSARALSLIRVNKNAAIHDHSTLLSPPNDRCCNNW